MKKTRAWSQRLACVRCVRTQRPRQHKVTWLGLVDSTGAASSDFTAGQNYRTGTLAYVPVQQVVIFVHAWKKDLTDTSQPFSGLQQS